MVKHSAQVDLRGYTAAIASCKAAGAWQVAARLHDATCPKTCVPNAVGIERESAPNGVGLVPRPSAQIHFCRQQMRQCRSCRTWKLLLSRLMLLGLQFAGLQVFARTNQEESKLVHPKVVTYNAVMSACEKGRDYDAADRVLSEMSKWAAWIKNAARSRYCLVDNRVS